MPKGTILDKVKSFFYESPQIEDIFGGFARKRAHMIDLDLGVNEFKLECKLFSFFFFLAFVTFK
jgi:hypothetical protein